MRLRALILVAALGAAGAAGCGDQPSGREPSAVSSNIVSSTSPPPSMPSGGVRAGLPEADRSDTDLTTLANLLADALPADSPAATDPYGAAQDVLLLCSSIRQDGAQAVADDKALTVVVYGARGASPDEFNATRRIEVRVACPEYLPLWDETPAAGG